MGEMWAKIKEWAYVDKKPTQAAEKVNHSSIMKYMNTPFMASFGGTKETIVKFIISRYHNEKFYFYKPVEISREFIYKLTGLSCHMPQFCKKYIIIFDFISRQYVKYYAKL